MFGLCLRCLLLKWRVVCYAVISKLYCLCLCVLGLFALCITLLFVFNTAFVDFYCGTIVCGDFCVYFVCALVVRGDLRIGLVVSCCFAAFTD